MASVIAQTTIAKSPAMRENGIPVMLRNLDIDLPNGQFSWPSYVAPCVMVRDVLLNQVKPLIVGAMPMLEGTSEDPSFGWRSYLCHQAAQDSGQNASALLRRLHATLNTAGVITYIENVERWLLTAGLDLDRDTDIPTLPGNRMLALDLLLVRAQAVDPKAKPKDVIPLIPDLLSLCYAIVENPEQLSDLQDDAPFDCLRPWR